MGVNEAKTAILENRTALGIEFGSTRIKAVLVDDKNQPIASGAYEWENQYVDGIWTYSLEEIWKGLQGSYQDMAEDVQKKYGVELTSVGAFGVSAMMHGYMPFNKEGELMVPFRTWRNNITGEASEKLAELFHYNIPQRWSIAHLYQAILNGEEHVKDIDYITTLEAYVHWKLTGKRVLGIGDAAGMFPIDSETKDYNEEMVQKFDELVAPYGFPWKLRDIMPKKNLINSLKNIGFGQQIEFPQTISKSSYSNSESFTNETQLANSGYGQGEVLVNPIHMAMMYSAFVNEGNMIMPYLEYKENASSQTAKYYKENAFSKEAANEVRDGLIQVVENPSGTAHSAKIEGKTIAGKTGTAEIKQSKDDTEGTEIGWFNAFNVGESDESLLLVVSMVENVKGKGGSHYLLPKVRAIFAQ